MYVFGTIWHRAALLHCSDLWNRYVLLTVCFKTLRKSISTQWTSYCHSLQIK